MRIRSALAGAVAAVALLGSVRVHAASPVDRFAVSAAKLLLAQRQVAEMCGEVESKNEAALKLIIDALSPDAMALASAEENDARPRLLTKSMKERVCLEAKMSAVERDHKIRQHKEVLHSMADALAPVRGTQGDEVGVASSGENYLSATIAQQRKWLQTFTSLKQVQHMTKNSPAVIEALDVCIRQSIASTGAIDRRKSSILTLTMYCLKQ